MDIKQLIKKRLPPVLVNWYKHIKHYKQGRGYIWDGIYQKYQDVPVAGRGYAGNRLTQETFAYTQKALTVSKQRSPLSALTEITGERPLLPLLVSILSIYRNEPIRILDFGGGMGIDYIYLTNSVFYKIAIDYHVVENSLVCQTATRLFEEDTHIHFHPSLPAKPSTMDIIYICSALQYVEDYTTLLKTLAGYHPEYFLFAKLSAGDIPTYATSQRNLPGTAANYWFINMHEIETIMAQNGYSLIFKSILEREYDQTNFPESHRLGRACNLLFKRADHE